MSPPSSPEEEALSSPEEQEHPSSRALSPVAATREVPNESDRIQVEAKDVRLSDMPPVTLDVTNVNTEIDDIAELNIVEDLDNRPSKKAKISELGVLEPKPMSPTMSASSPNSECFESIVPESDNQIDRDPLASPPSPSSSTLSPVLPLHDVKEPDSNKEIKVVQKYDYLPQDYTLTDYDLCARIIVESSLRKQELVQIDGSTVLQNQLMCLLDEKEWVNDDVIDAYIRCIKDQIHVQNGNKVYFESPFVISLLKRDGNLGIQQNSAFITEIVKKYMEHDMIELPINTSNTHWYLAILNTKKREIQVLDSLCWKFDRDDLAITLRGIQFHLDLIKSQNLINEDWKDVDLTEWKITEQFQKPVQKDSSSCGLFMVKFMEYFTGSALSYAITQEMITSFRFKLASILLCWKTNTASMTTIIEETDDDTNGDPDDVQILESLDDIKNSKQKIPLSVQIKYRSLISILSNMSLHELTSRLCSFIKSINYTEILEKVWIQSSKPYPISLSLKKLQGMLKDDLPMDRDCFNLVIWKIMFDDIQMTQKTKQLIAKHYMDMKFWMTTDFGRHPDFRKKLDVEQLANSVRSWPRIKYNVSKCKSIYIPVQSNNDFILFTLDKDTRTMYILDPAPINPIYRCNPLAKYVHKIIWIAEHLPKAMSKACPGSRWNENILLWHQKILDDIPIYNRELSGYIVPLFMSTWEDERPHLPFIDQNFRSVEKQSYLEGILGKCCPVVRKGTRAQIVDASLRRSQLRNSMRQLKLVRNMRAQNDKWFAEYLLCIGNGTEETNEDGEILLPTSICVPNKTDDNSLDRLIDSVYQTDNASLKDPKYIMSRAILSTRNDSVDRINLKMIDRFQGEEMVYHSFDSVEDDPHNYYPPEFLNTLTPNGLPPHMLKLKKNCPIILLRNIDPANGLCNGTRLVVRGFQKNTIDAEIVVGQHSGMRVFLPRIPLCPSDDDMFPFSFKRKQFPVRLSFAMTINKSQGQTIPNVDVYLPEPVFSHGQLYVALSRATTTANIKVLAGTHDVNNQKKKNTGTVDRCTRGKKNKKTSTSGTYTKNIVYKEVLTK